MAAATLDQMAETLKNAIGVERFSPQIRSALELAFVGHKGQVREQNDPRATPVPYIVHPVGVALIANELWDKAELSDSFDDVVSTALAHDLLEDTNVTAEELGRATSRRTVELVQALTKPNISPGLSRQQRNDVVIGRIAAAGGTPSFIKVCDFLQNVSRPSTTPAALFDKAIARGRGSFGKLFEGTNLSVALREEFERRLLVAEAEFGRMRQQRIAAAQPLRNLQEVFEYCVKSTQSKVLELHDVLEVLRSATAASFVVVDTIDLFSARLFDGQTPSQREIAVAKGALRSGRLDLDAAGVSIASDYLSGIKSVLAISVDVGRKPDSYFFLGVDRLVEGDWRSPAALKVLATYLSERLRSMERNERIRLTGELARLSLDLDVDDLIELNIDERELRSMRDLMNWADYAHAQLASSLRFNIVKGSLADEVDVFESRVKSPRSVLAKIKRRKLAGIFEIEDLVGFRFVCTTPTGASKVADALESYLAGGANLISRMQRHRTDGVVRRAVRTKVGYSAQHLTISLAPQNVSDGLRIGCEIQVRTLFEDAWARASRRFLYGARGPRYDQERSKFEKLAHLAAEADKLLRE